MSETLSVYKAWSGQIVSKEKSSMIFSNYISSSRRRELLGIMGFSWGSLPFKYLGVPIIVNRLAAAHFEDLVGKVREKFGGWSARLLSSGARLLLIPHVLSVGGVVRNESRRMISTFTVSIGHGTNIVVEFYLFYMVLELFGKKHITKGEIKMDSHVIINWINSSSCGVWYLDELCEELMVLLQQVTFSLRHIYRQGNSAADLRTN
ncbi:uncharacterized protein LOC121250855 [Juglans microcarpa x Juglans regia]|uniref:uncharacterized protein LOC121250855 n=1 Tax=Juglans microcarpa x Juglans regia TaxID=2249226 RepID=UPI001B7EDCF4|nr:uncharacterized protein LOC121250855 [Juglans microcarpa x Juglans regia]